MFCLGGYLFFAVLVCPIFLLTRSRVTWTAGRIVCLGGFLAASPTVFVYFWTFVVALTRGDGREFLGDLLDLDWSLFLSMVLAGIIVASVYSAIQSAVLPRDAK